MKIIQLVLTGIMFLSYGNILANGEFNSKYSPSDTISLQLSESAKVVNVPFGKSYRKNIPGFVTTINPEEILMYDNMSSLGEALTARNPGIITGTNLHGLGASMVFIDGIPGAFSDLNIEEVEQISILKDVNSAMFYGVQAGRGIIMITTRRGKIGKPVAEVVVDQGFSRPVIMPSYVNGAKYMELYNEALINDGLPAFYSLEDIAATESGSNKFRFPDTDYHSSEFLKAYKPFSRYRINFSGGNLNTQYFLNLGWTHSGSLMAFGEKEQANRMNIRSNVNFKVNDFMKAYIDISGNYNINKGPNGDFWADASSLYPNAFTPLIDTSLVTNLSSLSSPQYFQNGYLLGGTDVYKNSVYGNLLSSGYQRNYQSMFNYRTGLDIDLGSFLNGLSFKMLGSFIFNQNYLESQNNLYAVYQPNWTLNTDNEYTASLTQIGINRNFGTQALSNSFKRSRLAFYGLLDYTRNFSGRHDFSASLLAFSNYDRQTVSLYASKYNHMGGKINYIFDSKYIIDLSAIVTLSMQLDQNRIGYSPSVGLGWVISEEDFLANAGWIDYAKLKFSTGMLKTDVNISGYYLYNTNLSPGTGNLVFWGDGNISNNRVWISNIGNPLMDYEKRIDLNAGIESSLFNNSVWIDFNFFQERLTDILIQRSATTPAFLGGLYPYENYGEEKYTGLDLSLSYRKKAGKFGYEFGGNFTRLFSETVITDESWNNDYQYRAGKRTDGMWGLQAAGFFIDNNDISASVPQSFGTVKPGDIKYVDQNNDNIIDQNDIVLIGNNRPDFSAGVNLRLSYGNFSFFVLASGAFGHESYANSDYYWVYGNRKYSDVVLDRWTEATSPTAKYPRLTSLSSSNNFRNSTFWIYDSSRISINRMQLTYDIKPLAAKLNANNIGLYLRTENLRMFAKNRDKIQLNHNTEPQYTNYSIGIRAIF
jgi:TonB-linked SusC/RagA family outer membrane protein